tara:strand:- start:41 stop:169 length:129 start_codon:yes stop_codon:yes gene_type:complete
MVDRNKVIKKIAKLLEESNYKQARYLIGRLEITDKIERIGKI